MRVRQVQQTKANDEPDGLFDLASDLQRELNSEPEVARENLELENAKSVEEVLSDFKQGVEANIANDDAETHLNLGIAYREMGLLDEAIAELQIAAQDSDYSADCCSALGICFLEKGLPETAIEWYRKGLRTLHLHREVALGMLYDLGNTYVEINDGLAAYETFLQIYRLDTGYRDVKEKLAQLGEP